MLVTINCRTTRARKLLATFAFVSSGFIVAAMIALSLLIARADGGRHTFAPFVAEAVGFLARFGGIPGMGVALVGIGTAWLRQRHARRWYQNCGRAFDPHVADVIDRTAAERAARVAQRANRLLIAISVSILLISASSVIQMF